MGNFLNATILVGATFVVCLFLAVAHIISIKDAGEITKDVLICALGFFALKEGFKKGYEEYKKKSSKKM